MKKQTAVNASYLARVFSGDQANRPVVVVPGAQSPRMVGQSYGWEKIRGPHAGERVSATYARKWGKNVQYVGSTMQTEVGTEWIAARRNQAQYHEADGVRCILLPGRAARCGHVRVVPGWVTPSRERCFVVTRGNRSYHAARKGRLNEIIRATVEGVAAEARAAWARQDWTRRAVTYGAPVFSAGAELAPDEDVRVTLEDSRRAGNCVEGSLAFAERKLGMSREEIVVAGHLFSVPANRLIAVANGDLPRIEAAIKIAWLRETTVSI